jgi:hypothetical protein
MQLQQRFIIGEIGADRHFAWQQSSGPYVRFGSKADIEARPSDARFTPKSQTLELSRVMSALCQKRTHAL